MPFIQFLHKVKNDLEEGGRHFEPAIGGDENEPTKPCPKCEKQVADSQLWANHNTCNFCGYHFRMNARQRIKFITDADSFKELWGDMVSTDILCFPGYEKKLENAHTASDENDAVVCGTATVDGEECALFVMEPNFMMGSMGTVVGEKITRLFEYATEHKMSVVGYTVSGGARMQEGILSLMQMAKTSGAVKRHSDAGLFYLTVLTDPTTGGVMASFAMEGDIILAEPGATAGFAGARVIEQTTRKKLPQGFQKSEFILEHGFADAISPRQTQKETVSYLLKMHKGGTGNE